MPQLNPTPWFTILVFSWFIFLTVIPPKVLAHVFPNEMSAGAFELLTKKSWNWPWF